MKNHFLVALLSISGFVNSRLVVERDTLDVLNGNSGWTPPPDRKRDTLDVLNGNSGWTPPPDRKRDTTGKI
ncbi:hypothetical protein QQS21_008246 [Conoideocrella luteorostrata]|uniref:Secreted protein n=1 Tax=Conoideocrella luteorostrata TaxID=1105319 RepID=A0AAJ0FRL0_9HYPO|nr:hypothetical protein QQS21_008246 [Conoideocrella luteorostrata]